MIGVGSVRISAREKKYVNQVLDSDQLSYGPFSRRFEEGFARKHDCEFCILTNSGTSSLHIALAALREFGRWDDDDEVICPASTFVATPNVIVENNLHPRFVDVDPFIYNLDPNLIEDAITSRTKAIMVAHLYGQPAEMQPILEIADKHSLSIIEDSCETMFARYKGKSVGSFGTIGCFSTYACHIMATGVGGLTTTNNSELADIIRSLANHGRASEAPEDRFNFVRRGYSYRITEMEAALGLGQLESAAENIAIRKEVAIGLFSIEDHWLQLPIAGPYRDHSYMMFPMLIRENAPFTRKDITDYLAQCSIETRPMVSISNLYLKHIEDRFPVAKSINERGFYIGCHPEMLDKVGYVVEKVNGFLGRY